MLALIVSRWDSSCDQTLRIFVNTNVEVALVWGYVLGYNGELPHISL
jgi:hypothetical protein